MCCCGDDTKSVSSVAAVLGIIQSFVGMIMASVCINKYFGSQYDDLTVQALEHQETIRGLLVVYLLLEIYWLLSSVGLFVANQKDQICGVRQWLISTSFVIIAEVVFPATFASSTALNLSNGFMTQTVVTSSSSWSSYSTTRVYFMSGFMNGYLTLLFTFSKLGLITIITNIIMCVYVGRRAQSLASPSTGHVIAPAVFPVTVAVPSQMVPQPMPVYYPSQGQVPQQVYYPANTQIAFPGQQPGFYPGQQCYPYQPQQPFPQQAPQPAPSQQPSQPAPTLQPEAPPYSVNT